MRIVVVLSLGLLGFLAGCGGRSLEQEIERHPARVLPPGASQIFYARVDRLGENPLAVLAYEQAQKLNLGPLANTSQTLQLAGDIERLALGTYAAASDKRAAVVVVATGRFNEDVFRKALEAYRTPFVEGAHQTWRVYTCGRGESRCYVSFPSPQLLVVSSQENFLTRTLSLTKRGTKSMARERGFARLLKSFSPQMDLWATGVFPGALPIAFDEQVQAAMQFVFTFYISGEQTKRLDLILHCGSSEEAEANAKGLRALVAGLTQQLVLGGYTIPDLISAINRSQILVEGKTADFRLEMSKAEMAATAAALRAEPKAPLLEGFPPAALPGK